MTKFQLLSFTFTLVVILNVLAGCGAGSSAAMPGRIGPQALDRNLAAPLSGRFTISRARGDLLGRTVS